MAQPLRFGRRLAIPSKRQIIHEMRMMQAEEERLKAALLPVAQASETAEHDLLRVVQDRAAGI